MLTAPLTLNLMLAMLLTAQCISQIWNNKQTNKEKTDFGGLLDVFVISHLTVGTFFQI